MPSTAVNFGPMQPPCNARARVPANQPSHRRGLRGFRTCNDFCFAESDGTWISRSLPGGTLDGTTFFFQPFAHSGNAVALLGSTTASDALGDTLTPAMPLNTLPGKQYSIGFSHSSSFSLPNEEARRIHRCVMERDHDPDSLSGVQQVPVLPIRRDGARPRRA
jgi:hypothetical protein